MISRTAAEREPLNWQTDMARAVTDPAELIRLLGLSERLLPAARRAAALFPLRVPRPFVDLMHAGDPCDPLLRQVLPLGEETAVAAGFDADPVGDAAAACGGGVLRKYRGRALLITTPVCAVNCRYCFRRTFAYTAHSANRKRWSEALAIVRGDAEIDEVILSGGDPLTLDDAKLSELFALLAAIPHLRRLRIHTRLPVVLPHRVTPELVQLLHDFPLPTVTVLHFNHPREIGAACTAALGPLSAATTLLNQSVLLRGVNDDAQTLTALSERLFDTGVLPYYIHLLDRVSGAAHFEVAENEARALLRDLRSRLPGYLVPRLVRESAGAPAKIPII